MTSDVDGEKLCFWQNENVDGTNANAISGKAFDSFKATCDSKHCHTVN